MAIDRSRKPYILYDVRCLSCGIVSGDAATKPLWRSDKLWRAADAMAERIGLLLAKHKFKVRGFHSLYFTPTTKRLHLQRGPHDLEFEWWQREIAVPIDLKQWLRWRSMPSSASMQAILLDWFERGLRVVAKKFEHDRRIVDDIFRQLRAEGADTRVLHRDVQNRSGYAACFIRIPDTLKPVELIVTAQPAAEPGVTREARMKVSLVDEARMLCRGMRLSGTHVELTRPRSLRSSVWTEGYPRPLRFSLRRMTVTRKATPT